MKCIQLLLKILNTLSVYRFIKREGDNMEEKIQIIAIRLTPETLIEITVALYDDAPATILSVKLDGQELFE